MALDVQDIVLDGDFVSNEPVQCLRRPRTTSNLGIAVITEEPFSVWATVVPANGRQLQRLSDMDRTGAGIAIYTAHNMVCEADGFAPDIIIWKGQRYLCAFVDDFSTNGFNGVVASLTQVVGPDTAALPN